MRDVGVFGGDDADAPVMIRGPTGVALSVRQNLIFRDNSSAASLKDFSPTNSPRRPLSFSPKYQSSAQSLPWKGSLLGADAAVFASQKRRTAPDRALVGPIDVNFLFQNRVLCRHRRTLPTRVQACERDV